MNLLGIGASVFTSNIGSELLSSKYRFTINSGFKVETTSQTIMNLTIGRINGGIHNNVGKWSSQLGGKGAIKGMEYIFTTAGMTGTKLFGDGFLGN
jgi:hypothetical protein